jgi:hypothetical protein
MQGSAVRNGWIFRGVLGLIVVSAACALLGGATALAAEPEVRVFDEVRSLTGGCSTSTLDPVADPGCPTLPHQPGSFTAPAGVVTDFYGNIFISSDKGKDGRVDVFDSDGQFITQLIVPSGAGSLAVDSEGNLFVVTGTGDLIRYEPTLPYEPESGVIAYGAAPELVDSGFASMALAIDISNDHLFAHHGGRIFEYAAASEENKLLDSTIGEGIIGENLVAVGLAVDTSRDRIYVGVSGNLVGRVVKVLDLNAPHELLQTIDGSEVPAGKFQIFFSLAADEKTGNFFVYSDDKAVYEFTPDGEYLQSIEHGFEYLDNQKIGVDNGPHSPNGVLNPDGRYLFVPSHPSGIGHVFAFGPQPLQCPPDVKSTAFADVTEGEAELQAVINPCNLATSYVFEYTTQQEFEEEGFEGAVVAGQGQISGGSGVSVAASATGLLAGTVYRFRVIADNDKGEDGGEGEFSTYPPADLPEPCSNDPFRVELSAGLPDCRAYELVTPPDTNARTPRGVGNLGIYFATRESSPDGNTVSFLTEGGSIPGNEGTGSLGGDPYLTTRGGGGWETASAGPAGGETSALRPGSTSPDQGYSFWGTAGSAGSAGVEGEEVNYVRYPDGHSELVGRGSLGTDHDAEPQLISEHGGHIVFSSDVKLEEEAPSSGTDAVYERTPDEVTHVVSLLPGGATPAGDAIYQGGSLDGEGLAFKVGSTLYLRHNEETYDVGAGVTFAGVAEGGERIFYVEGGQLKAFDVEDGVIEFNTSGSVTPVNVSADGTAAYFVSTSTLTGEANPQGQFPQAGEQNLYLSNEGALSFVGIVTKRDVEGEFGGIEQIEGLGLWTVAVGIIDGSPGRFAIDPSRVTPDGSVLLFESRANLTGYDPDGHVQVYRYDSVNEELSCLSCNPTLAPATGEASLQSIAQSQDDPEPFSTFAMAMNLRADGRRAFFQSDEALVPHDTDGLQDVYEWEDLGVGSCDRAGGCVYLISSGHSDQVDYLYAVSDSGNDVFFRSADLLLGLDGDRTPSIYDARVGGGFPEQEGDDCVGEGCKPALTPAPVLGTPGLLPSSRPANAPPPRGCPKGKHKVKKGGKARCVKKSQKHRKAGSKRKGAGK